VIHDFFRNHREAINDAVWRELSVLADRVADAGDAALETALRCIVAHRMMPTLTRRGNPRRWDWRLDYEDYLPAALRRRYPRSESRFLEDKIAFAQLAAQKANKADTRHTSYATAADAFWYLALVFAAHPEWMPPSPVEQK
jgi:hypothetical protein